MCLFLQSYHKNLKKALLTDNTIMLWNDGCDYLPQLLVVLEALLVHAWFVPVCFDLIAEASLSCAADNVVAVEWLDLCDPLLTSCTSLYLFTS